MSETFFPGMKFDSLRSTLGADEDEAQEQQRRKQAAQPSGDFNDILQRASELKAAQMKDKRRAWEATPEFMKNTMVSTLPPKALFCSCSVCSVFIIFSNH